MAGIRVEVDREVCQSSGYCVHTAPQVFALDAEGIVALHSGGELTGGPIEVTAGQAELVDRAAWDCPAAAITITAAESSPS
ncbi:ferredoxin [Nocardia sp. NPDC088792]|uniref:ferredoxin n=1 Tax=Nocardia sp. NPDC088792 TaxID=3364332 RepID=UPI0038206779